jgi:putative transposase
MFLKRNFMSRYRRANVCGGCYFFTVVTERRQPILIDGPVRIALRDAIIRVREQYPFEINAWVLLPDHLHAIWTLPPNDANFALRWRLIKTHVTRTCGHLYFNPQWLTKRRASKQSGTLWQHRYWEHCIRDQKDFNHHMDYLHMNPVKHKLIKHASEWPYSSFHRYAREGIYSHDWMGCM